jgi:hypothetical protein
MKTKPLSHKVRLKDTTFILGDKPIRTLMWCDCVPKAKRNKPAKLNGIVVGSISVYHEL